MLADNLLIGPGHPFGVYVAAHYQPGFRPILRWVMIQILLSSIDKPS